MRATILLFVALAAITAVGQQRRVLNGDPAQVRFVTSDIDNFWRAYDLAAKETDHDKKVAIFQAEYFDKGTAGLKDFLRLKIQSADRLVNTIERLPKFYAQARQPTLSIGRMEGPLREAFKRLKTLYPDAVFPDVYFVIGRASSGGDASDNGLLIGGEMSALTPSADMNELTPWLRMVLRPVDNIPAIVSHESCHFNQHFNPGPTLLGKAIQEGSCDFIGELMSGGNINSHLAEYARTHDKEIWDAFRAQMSQPDFSNWVYNAGTTKDTPADLGYYVGYRIAEGYYKQAADKKAAIREIFNIKDFNAFLLASKVLPSDAPAPAAR